MFIFIVSFIIVCEQHHFRLLFTHNSFPCPCSHHSTTYHDLNWGIGHRLLTLKHIGICVHVCTCACTPPPKVVCPGPLSHVKVLVVDRRDSRFGHP